MTYLEKRRYFNIIFFILLGILITLIFFFSTLGIADISFVDSVKIVLSKIPKVKDFINTDSIKDTSFTIVLNIRMPRIIVATLVGAGLSVVGAAFQGIFKNPMADPFVLGVSSGAAFGATLAIIFGAGASLLGTGMITFSAFIGAIITVSIVYSIAYTNGRLPSITLILSGIAIDYLLRSIISLLMIFNREDIEKIVMWTMGSVAASGWKQVFILLPIIILGVVFIATFSRDINLISTGNETAKSLGIDVQKVKKIILVVSSLIVALIVSVSGIIGFAGLVIPHIIRLIFGADHRVLIPFSAIGGAIFVVICDTLARTIIPPIEIPVGAITSLFGAPFFIYLLIVNKKKVI